MACYLDCLDKDTEFQPCTIYYISGRENPFLKAHYETADPVYKIVICIRINTAFRKVFAKETVYFFNTRMYSKLFSKEKQVLIMSFYMASLSPSRYLFLRPGDNPRDSYIIWFLFVQVLLSSAHVLYCWLINAQIYKESSTEGQEPVANFNQPIPERK